MHVPDHVLDPGVSAAGAVLAVTTVTCCVLRVRRSSTGGVGRGTATPGPHAGTAGAVAALAFAAQMLDHPVAPGTSGHVIGAALAAVVLGPSMGTLVLSIVVVVQCVAFGDGGVTALGPNVMLLAVVPTVTASAVVHLAGRKLAGCRLTSRSPGAERWGPAVVAGGAAWVSVMAASATFSLQFALGGPASVPAGAVADEMMRTHAVAGLVEAALTTAVVAWLVQDRARRRAMDLHPAGQG